MRALRALRRDGRGRGGGDRGDGRGHLPRARSRAPAIRHGGGRGAQRARLCVLGSGGQARRTAGARASRPRRAQTRHHRLDDLAANLAACAQAGVTLVEQPLPADRDDALAHIARPIAICADESVHARASLPSLVGKYDAVNIKLDKTGGLTEALVMAGEAERLGFTVMVGCMVATSLALAPAMLVAQRARVVDLDGALLLARDRPDGLRYDGSQVHPPTPALWG